MMSEHASRQKRAIPTLAPATRIDRGRCSSAFQNAQIERLLVEKKARKWHFQFLLEKILPFNVYIFVLLHSLKEHFQILQRFPMILM